MKKLTLLLLLLVSTNVYSWFLFSPKDYEECRDESAREAKNRDALRILIDSCSEQFPARRKPEGGYQYCRSGGCIDVSDPKLNKSDWAKIKSTKPWEMHWNNPTTNNNQ